MSNPFFTDKKLKMKFGEAFKVHMWLPEEHRA